MLAIRPFILKTAGVVTTGSEVYHGRIKDTLTPVIIDKLKEYGIEVCMHMIVDDKPEQITEAIRTMKEAKVDMILCTGGMSVDPDDVIPLSIRLWSKYRILWSPSSSRCHVFCLVILKMIHQL